LYKYKALRLSYENASIFAAFALVAFIPGSVFFALSSLAPELSLIRLRHPEGVSTKDPVKLFVELSPLPKIPEPVEGPGISF